MAHADVLMRFGGIVAVRVGFLWHFDRHGDELAMPHAALGDEMPGIMPHIRGFPLRIATSMQLS